MADPQKDTQPPVGMVPRADGRTALGLPEKIALALSVLWLVAALVFFLVLPGDPDGGFDPATFIMTLLAVFMPVALFWVAATAARNNRIVQEESQRLQAAVDTLRHAYVAHNQAQGTGSRTPLEKSISDVAASQRKLQATVEALGGGVPLQGVDRATVVAPKPDNQPDVAEDQPALALGTPAEALADPISTGDFIKAMNFPEDEKDSDGFRALRLALRDRTSSGLIRSAQDVLTLLSEDGIYMDDLSPDIAAPEIWRKFAQGERGRPITALGGIRDRSCLALTAGRMRQDHVFRDASHHFLRKFDQTFAVFEKNATDTDIAALADTRSARAFMLLGRVTGTFD